MTGTGAEHMRREPWTARVRRTNDVVDPAPIRALAALFDDGLPAPAAGEPLPALWHWAGLSRWSESGRTGPDGHPVRGSFLPPIDLPRRMFAGGEVEFHRAVTVGETVRQESVVESVAEKRGRSGPLVVVTVATRIYAEHGPLAITEKQNLIYRESGPLSAAAPVARAAAESSLVGAPLRFVADRTWDFVTDPVLLVRFSAVTSNTHRIHYDWPYATLIEGYPGLLVHGPLTSLALVETLRLQGLAGRIRRLRHRNLRPLFCAEPAQLRHTGQDEEPQRLEMHKHGEPDPCVRLDVEFSDASFEEGNHEP
ncbi:MaoC family dehydratase N-terminal domain-containing protein [Nocardia sp. NBC_00881]|uniref:FAS1-like dehydratase domain-containing protein n=1 Tax=Nocardia sp. NBC_00881 TaxID=2975995 RepID=UPI00386EFCEE|nr:MaoC family dehydratase N-terminal domain-containing protein [Nocardia sp. NBC_00881]